MGPGELTAEELQAAGLVPENDALVDHLIQDMRENALRIVIPVYNAREVLYPKRSLKLLMPDTE